MPGPSPLIDAEGRMPSEPASIEASSERMSPNRFPETCKGSEELVEVKAKEW